MNLIQWLNSFVGSNIYIIECIHALGRWTKLADIHALSFGSVAPMFLRGGPRLDKL